MGLDRRRFLELATCSAAGSLISGCAGSRKTARIARGNAGVSVDQLDAVANQPVLNLPGLDTPIVIESIRLLQKGREYFVHVRSKDGAEGIAVTNSRVPLLHPILNRCVIPYFIGKDARDLEEHLFGVYRHQSNYKLQGLAFWCPVAWAEFAILDMLGRVAGKSIGELFGPVIRREVPFYVASGRRDTTPEAEVEYIQELIEETGARAVKFRVGGRMSRNADALPGRTEGLIRLSR